MSKISLPDTITHPADPELQSEENQPLLSKPKTPLPKLQLSLLFFIRATDPICFQVIFPFINQMLLDIGASDDPDRVGYKAGLVGRPPYVTGS